MLVDGHVWPKFAYKRYVSSLGKGGSFINLTGNDVKGRRIYNRQTTKYMFCAPCDNDAIGQLDDAASRLCHRFDENPTEPQTYDGKFTRFAVSLAFRVALLNLDGRPTSADGPLRSAAKIWREFLVGRRKSVGAFTQHAFVVYDKDAGLHKAVGGQVFPEQGLLLMQIGPIFMFSILNRTGMSAADLRAWDASLLCVNGGIITPISKWLVNDNISMDCARVLAAHDSWAKATLLQLPE